MRRQEGERVGQSDGLTVGREEGKNVREKMPPSSPFVFDVLPKANSEQLPTIDYWPPAGKVVECMICGRHTDHTV